MCKGISMTGDLRPQKNDAVIGHDEPGRRKDYVAVSHRRETVNIEGDRKKHSSNQRQVLPFRLKSGCEIPGSQAFIFGSPALLLSDLGQQESPSPMADSRLLHQQQAHWLDDLCRRSDRNNSGASQDNREVTFG
jgi:hypothetical protein